MTKTQKKLIELANARGGYYAVEAGGGRGAKGGKINFGNRERDALFALANLGLVEITSQQSSSIPMGDGNTVRTTVWNYKTVPTKQDFAAAIGPCGK